MGSTLGGTKVTITGEHFGSVATDNPVKIGDQYCLVLETSENEIICRIEAPQTTQAASTETVIVFARTSEEMVCNASPDCDFEYVTPTATVNSISSEYDSVSNSIRITVTGTDLPASTLNAELYLDGHLQNVVTVSDTEAVFELVEINGSTITDIKVYFEDGTPNGELTSLTIDPVLLGTEVSQGSSGGTRFKV